MSIRTSVLHISSMTNTTRVTYELLLVSLCSVVSVCVVLIRVWVFLFVLIWFGFRFCLLAFGFCSVFIVAFCFFLPSFLSFLSFHGHKSFGTCFAKSSMFGFHGELRTASQGVVSTGAWA